MLINVGGFCYRFRGVKVIVEVLRGSEVGRVSRI